MLKVLFLDYRELEWLDGFTRELRPLTKEPAPLFVADQPWEEGNVQFYGSVTRRSDGLWQMWYSSVMSPFRIKLCYAESEDGLNWRRPTFGHNPWDGQPSGIVYHEDPHGAAVILDEDDPRPEFRYKMLAGTLPSHCITALHSADGIHWTKYRVGPVIGTGPDCPMGFLKCADGRYAAYHRLDGKGRRPHRSESWDFRYWTGEPRLVCEPDAADPPQLQFYGLGSTTYGPYELGTLWAYHTERDDPSGGKMRGVQQTELAYSRGGYAWHRAQQGEHLLPHGGPEDWDRGNIQPASQPVFLADEVRYYYAGGTMRHKVWWELDPQTAGIGVARTKPDRWIALAAGDAPAELVTIGGKLPAGRVYVNAECAPDGWVKVELLDRAFQPVPGYAAEAARLTGDSTALQARWGEQDLIPAGDARLKVTAHRAKVYSVYVVEPDERPDYRQFTTLA